MYEAYFLSSTIQCVFMLQNAAIDPNKLDRTNDAANGPAALERQKSETTIAN